MPVGDGVHTGIKEERTFTWPLRMKSVCYDGKGVGGGKGYLNNNV